MNEEELSDFEEGILQNIEEHGCQVNHIFDPDGEEPAFSYSIGFPNSVKQPEVIVFGLSNELMRSMVNNVLQKCRDGMILSDGLVIDGLLEGHVCVARAVTPENIVEDFFASAMWYYRFETGEDMSKAFQIVWPGAEQGLFPWDAECDGSVIEMQPALYGKETVH